MHVNNAYMFYAPYASKEVWKSQNGAKTLVNLGTGKKLTCLDGWWKQFEVAVVSTMTKRNHADSIEPKSRNQSQVGWIIV